MTEDDRTIRKAYLFFVSDIGELVTTLDNAHPSHKQCTRTRGNTDRT